MYLNLVAMSTGGITSIKVTLQFIQCIASLTRYRYHIYTAENLKRVSSFARKAGFCKRKSTIKLGVGLGNIS